MHDWVIRGGRIVDGTGAPAQVGDVAIDARPDDFLAALTWSFIIFAVLTAVGLAMAARPARADPAGGYCAT